MKKFCYILMLILSVPQFCGAGIRHRFATYNVRYVNANNGDTGDQLWANRREYVTQIVKDYDFDIVGMQELTGNNKDSETGKSQMQDICDMLSDYTMIAYERSGSGTYSYTGLMYKTAKYTCMQQGCFWISETPDVAGSYGWGTAIQRLVAWAQMQVKETGEIFYFASLHSNGPGENAKIGHKGAKVVTDKLNTIAGNYPLVLVGDFNTSLTNGLTTYRGYAANLFDGTFTADTVYCLPTTNPQTNYTSYGWTPITATPSNVYHFDHIFYRQMHMFSQHTITEYYGRSVNPSDHFPVMGIFELQTDLQPRAWYVRKGSVNGNGSKQMPFGAIAEAFQAAQLPYDTIRMSADTYCECLEAPVSLIIEGGYNADFSARTGKTIWSADVNGDDAEGSYVDNYTTLLTANYASLNISDVEFQNVYGTTTAGKGGAISTTGFELTLCRTYFTGNHIVGLGAALYASCENIMLDSCRFTNNISESTGGAACVAALSDITINSSEFTENKAQSGSAIAVNGAENTRFQNNTFANNVSTKFGTLQLASYPYAETHNFINNTFANNALESPSGLAAVTKTYGGVAIWAQMYAASVKVNMAHNTIVGNTATFAGTADGKFYGAALNLFSGKVVLKNNMIVGNYSDALAADVYADENVVWTVDAYNVYTAASSLSFEPKLTNQLASNYQAGLEQIAQTLQGNVANGKFTAVLSDNGGFTPTVRVLSPFYGNAAINCIPYNYRMIEAAFGIDMDADGSISGYLKYDQRGVERQTQSCIGAFEYIREMKMVDNYVDMLNVVYLGEGRYEICGLADGTKITVYDVNGKTVISSKQPIINLSACAEGIYLCVAGGKLRKIVH